MAPGPRSIPALARRSQRLQMHILDTRVFERALERRLRKSWPPRQRQRANVDHPFDAGLLQRRDEFRHRRAFVTNGEDPHRGWIARPSATNSPHAIRHSDHRRRARRERGGVAARGSRTARSAKRDARRRRHDAGARDRRLAEMVCSNSFRSDDAEHNAVGLLHQEMRALGLADHARRRRASGARRIGARGRPRRLCRGGHAALEQHPNITIVRERVDALPGSVRRSSPPGRSPGRSLAEAIAAETGADALAFFDAIAPIVHRDSIDMDVAWMAARWDKGGKDYINCPLDKEQYRDLRPGAGRRREDAVQGLGEGHALFRGLHADRGDGRARAGDVALRPDEGGRPRRSAHRALALCGGATAPGQ